MRFATLWILAASLGLAAPALAQTATMPPSSAPQQATPPGQNGGPLQVEITGSIRFSNDMIIDGKIEGEIISEKGRVTIGENAVVKGNVTAGDVKVFGKIEGKITSERCELKTKSRLDGDIKAKMFSMEEGAQLSGRTEIG